MIPPFRPYGKVTYSKPLLSNSGFTLSIASEGIDTRSSKGRPIGLVASIIILDESRSPRVERSRLLLLGGNSWI